MARPTPAATAAALRALAGTVTPGLTVAQLDALEHGLYLLLGHGNDASARMVRNGSYAAGTAYIPGDVVESGGLWYVSTTAQTGVAPPGATWDQVPSGGGGGGTMDHAALTSNLNAGTSGHLLAAGAAGRLWGFDAAGAYHSYVIGTDVQAYSSQLTALAALSPAAQYQVPMSGAGPGFAWGLGTLGSAAFLASSAFQPADPDLTDIAGIARVRGDLMVADSTPKWTRLPLGTSGYPLVAGTTDPSYAKITQSVSHESPDTDAAAGSLHHTLGTGATQAMPGNATPTPAAHASAHEGLGSDALPGLLDCPTAYTAPPAAATLTWVNQTAGGVTANAADRGKTLCLYSNYRTSDNYSLLVTTGTTIAACFEVNQTRKNYMAGGLCWCENGATPKIETVTIVWVSTQLVLAWVKWNSPSSWNYDRATLLTALPIQHRIWLRLRDDGTYRYVQFWDHGSNDWITLSSQVSRTDFLTPTRVGLALNPSIPSGSASGDKVGITCYSWSVS